MLRYYDGRKLRGELVMEQGVEVHQSERYQSRFMVTARKQGKQKTKTYEFEDLQNN